MSREPAPLLEIRQLVKNFGGFRALDGISLTLAPGEVLGLVGPNGSGKTTCINAISGLYRPDGGDILFDGQSIGGTASHLLARRGINRTFQSPHCFRGLTVRENVAVAARYGNPGPTPPDLDALLASLELDQHRRRPAGDLNSAEQKRLDLARALATGPRLLLVDELAAGLNPRELTGIADRLRALADGGMALLVVEHLLGFIDRLTDRVIVMNAGREIFEGKLAAAARDPEVVRVFLGIPMAADLLIARDLVSGYDTVQALWGASLTVQAGESVVLLGVNGAGKTTLLKVLLGLLPAWSGSVTLDGADITRLRTDRRVRLGLAYMSELGVFPGLSIAENLRIGGQFAEPAALKRRIEELYAIFPDLAARRHTLAGSLSGGQRKMCGIAKALAGGPRLLVMDEPSAGLSPLFVGEVIRILGQFRGQGLSLLIAEQNVAFLDLADRVFTLERGRTGFAGSVAELQADDGVRKAYFGLG